MNVKITFEVFPMIVFVGVVQGVICALIALLSCRSRGRASLFFALLIGSISLSIIPFPLYKSNLYYYLPWLTKVVDFLQFLFGPALFLHVKELTQHKGGSKRSDLIHFIIFLIALILTVPLFFQDYESQLRIAELSLMDENDLLRDLRELFSTLHVWFYLLLSLRIISRYRARLKDSFSSIEKLNLGWIYTCLKIMMGAFGTLLFLDILMLTGVDLRVIIVITAVIASLGVYSITFLFFIYINNYSQTVRLTIEKVNIPYNSSPLTAEEIKSHWEKLEGLMSSEKLYLNNELSLADLAARLEIPRQYLSQVINQMAGLKFYDYVNRYRVEEFIRLISLKEKQNHTILSVAFDAGFNSKSSFNSFFKKDRGMTPSQYIKEKSSSR